MVLVPRMQLVTFALPAAAGAQTLFPTVKNLLGSDVEILGVVAYSAAQLSNGPDQQAVVSAADSIKLTVTLQKGSDQIIQAVPYSDLIRSVNAGLWWALRPINLDLTKSYVKNNVAITASSAAFVFIYRLKSERL